MQAIDLFSGAGGMSIGALVSGIDVRYAVEFDSSAAETYLKNHKDVKMINKDIKVVKASDFKIDNTQPTIIFGGPPCQGFSSSNMKDRHQDNDKNWLFKHYLRLAKDIRPDWLLLENVKGLKTTENGFFLASIKDGFKKIGYTVSDFTLNAADYGVPQSRERVFVIGSKHGISIEKPIPSPNNKITTVQDAIEDLPQISNGNKIDIKRYQKSPTSSYAKKIRKKRMLCYNNMVTLNNDLVIARYKHIPQGGNWKNIPEKLMKNYKDSAKCHAHTYHRLNPLKPAVVIANFRKSMIIHPYKNRGLSVREAARLQSFPDSFIFTGTISQQQQQVGNAVPPLLAQQIFKCMTRKE